MDFYKKVSQTSGVYSIKEHLLAMKAGFKCDRLGDSLRANLLELKFNRNVSAQKLIDTLLGGVEEEDTIYDKDKIDELIQIVEADKIIKKTPHTYSEYFREEGE